MKEVLDLLDAGLKENEVDALEAALRQMEEGSDGAFRILDKILQQKLG